MHWPHLPLFWPLQKNSKIRINNLKPVGKDGTTRILAIVGPTAAGKTAAAIRLAKKIDAEIVSCDSRAVYKGVPTLTAVPEGRWQKGVFITKEGVPYHLVDFLNPKVRWNAYDYAVCAKARIAKILTRKPHVIVAGGSGLYYRALFQGLSPFPGAHPGIRRKFEQIISKQGVKALADQLKIKDPVTFQRIDRNNPRRLIRALELCELLGKPLSGYLSQKQSLGWPFLTLYLNWPKEKLWQRIAKRAERGFDAMTREVKYLKKNFDSQAPVWEALLAGPIERHLSKKISRKIAIEECIQQDKAYAKKQVTWFKKEKGIISIGIGNNKDLLEAIHDIYASLNKYQ